MAVCNPEIGLAEQMMLSFLFRWKYVVKEPHSLEELLDTENHSGMGKDLLRMRGRRSYVLVLLLLVASAFIPESISAPSSSDYLIGVGSYDITGPAADVNMMGYANPTQNAAGIHLRLRARAFIVAEPSRNMDGNRVVFVNLDACMASMAVTLRVLSRLHERWRF